MTHQNSDMIWRWMRYGLLAVCIALSIIVWLRLSYPRFSQIDLSVSRAQALNIATDYMMSKNRHIDVAVYKHAIVFEVDNPTDQYLQKAVGFDEGEKFINRHQYDLFYWSVRFFKESQKEEFRVAVSSKTGEVISYNHMLEDSQERAEISEANAEIKAKDFLKQKFNFDFNQWGFNARTHSKFDHRTEYTFTWEKKNVYIPWDPTPSNGGGKLLATVSVSGDEILSYSKQLFSIPDQFTRHVERSRESGRNLSLISNIGSIIFIIGAIWMIIVRLNHLTMHATKRFYILVVLLLFVLSVLSGLNNAQGYIFSYPTTQPYIPYLIRQAIYEVLDRFLFFFCFIIPCLAGEFLRFEISPQKKNASMFHYVTTTFLARDIFKLVLLGYCFAVVMIGLQTLIFEFGYHFFDVWMERGRLGSFSTAYFPFFGVLILAFNASISEESFFRLFGVNFFFKLFRKVLPAILIPSIIWGFGHSGYMVFPFWFRGLEVTCLGIFISIIYLRCGLICVVVLHYVFDAFWASAPYLFGKTHYANFWMSLSVILLPLIWGIIAYVVNRPVNAKQVQWTLNKPQQYNLEILKLFLQEQRRGQAFDAEFQKKQLIQAGWDIAIIEVAYEHLNIPISNAQSPNRP